MEDYVSYYSGVVAGVESRMGQTLAREQLWQTQWDMMVSSLLASVKDIA